ncbi:ketopantoate reductase family protein [Paenibacillus rhizoplanae]
MITSYNMLLDNQEGILIGRSDCNVSKNKNRILIFGAGVIGSIYAMKFMEAGYDVSLFARSDRFRLLKEKKACNIMTKVQSDRFR